MYHVWTDIKGIDRLYKPAKEEEAVVQKEADKYKSYQSEAKELTGNRDPKFYQMFPEQHATRYTSVCSYAPLTLYYTTMLEPLVLMPNAHKSSSMRLSIL
eukprot:2556845-Amphidinium_carterae.1